MKTKPCLKLYNVKISCIEDGSELVADVKTVIARTAIEAGARVRLHKRKNYEEFISGIELIDKIDKP